MSHTAREVAEAEQRVAWLMRHPDLSFWLKRTLQTALTQDPIKVLNETELLHDALRFRTTAIVRHALEGGEGRRAP